MTQFFNQAEANNFRSDVMEHFSQLRVDGVSNISDKETGEYQYSYFSVWFGNEYLFHTYVACQEDWDIFLSTCQYIAQAIADNRQSEEVDIEMQADMYIARKDVRKAEKEISLMEMGTPIHLKTPNTF